MTKAIYQADVSAPDGRSVAVKFMDNGTVHVVFPPGHAWSILTHFSGDKGTRVRFAPVGAPAATVLEDEAE